MFFFILLKGFSKKLWFLLKISKCGERKGVWEGSSLLRKYNFIKESIEEGVKYRVWKGGEEGVEFVDYV